MPRWKSDLFCTGALLICSWKLSILRLTRWFFSGVAFFSASSLATISWRLSSLTGVVHSICVSSSWTLIAPPWSSVLP